MYVRKKEFTCNARGRPLEATPSKKFAGSDAKKPRATLQSLAVPTMQRALYTLPARALLLRSRCTQQRALSSLPPHRLMPMPRLSPSMNTGRLDQWLVAVGGEVISEHIICEVSTSELTEDPDDGTLVLQIESHEDGFLAKILLPDVRALAPNPHAASAATTHAKRPRVRARRARPRRQTCRSQSSARTPATWPPSVTSKRQT